MKLPFLVNIKIPIQRQALLLRRVVVHGHLELLDVCRRQLRPVDGKSQLVELASETERHLVVLVVHRLPASAPTSKFSSHCRVIGIVFSIFCVATTLPSTLSTPVPLRPRPLGLPNASVAAPRRNQLSQRTGVRALCPGKVTVIRRLLECCIDHRRTGLCRHQHFLSCIQTLVWRKPHPVAKSQHQAPGERLALTASKSVLVAPGSGC